MELESEPVVEGVTLGLCNIYENIFELFSAVGILNRSINLTENSQVVKPLLRVQHIDLAKRVARLHLNLACGHRALGVLQSREHHVPDRYLVPFMNGVDDIHAVGIIWHRVC